MDKPIATVHYFTASWCGPCKAFAPAWDLVTGLFTDITFVKVDVDENPKLAEAEGIRSIPTLIFQSGDVKVVKSGGGLNGVTFKTWIYECLYKLP